MKQLFVFLIAITFFSCGKDDKDLPPLNNLKAETLKDQKYISSSSNKSHVMDVYLPAGRNMSSTKSLIIIHGGAWVEGDKSDLNNYISQIQKLLPDYAIFNINYRLFEVVRFGFPAQEEDVRAAVEYINSKRNEFAISSNFVLLGASAGGHLALLQAYKNPNNSIVKPKAVVSFFGPTDLTELYNFYSVAEPDVAFGLSVLLGGTPTQKPQMYYNSSPVNYVNTQSPPTIILQGGADNTVPKEQSYTLEAKLKSANVTNQLVYYPNLGHDEWPEQQMNESFAKIVTFLKTNVP